MRGVPDDDEVRPAMATSPSGSKWVLKNLWFGLIIYSQIWPPVRFDHSGLLPQNSGKRGGLVLTSYHLCVGGGGRKGGLKGGGQETKGHPRITSFAGPDNSHLVRQGFQLFCVWGRRHLSQGQFPAIQVLTCIIMGEQLFSVSMAFSELLTVFYCRPPSFICAGCTYILYPDFKSEFQYHSTIEMCSVLKFKHSMEYFCFMKQWNKQSGGPFFLKISSVMRNLIFFISVIKNLQRIWN